MNPETLTITQDLPSRVIMDKPPVLETLIQLSYRPSDSKTPWGQETWNAFYENIKDRGYSLGQFKIETGLEIKGRPDRLESITPTNRVIRAQGRKKESNYWIHLGDDLLALSLMRQGTDQPGYRELSNEMIILHERYCQLLSPQGVNRANLVYVDLLEIPLRFGSFEVNDYIHIHPYTPPAFPGNIRLFSINLLLSGQNPQEWLRLKLRQEPPSSDDKSRYQLIWDYGIPLPGNQETLSTDAIIAHLDRAHSYVYDCFLKSFGEKSWALFQRHS